MKENLSCRIDETRVLLPAPFFSLLLCVPPLQLHALAAGWLHFEDLKPHSSEQLLGVGRISLPPFFHLEPLRLTHSFQELQHVFCLLNRLF